ncbi:hypothetical protein CVIRNUC_000106 [Coccomyxa viridis]|uniref:Uncharacterized protein n=1 Tax=Coccomyxa viridis TaxID=1274662 RepID=A0AAV1HSU3_9CHLO|nr:hypothetical protein CVIRNUC_000106 [Coccomyxa viridis]
MDAVCEQLQKLDSERADLAGKVETARDSWLKAQDTRQEVKLEKVYEDLKKELELLNMMRRDLQNKLPSSGVLPADLISQLVAGLASLQSGLQGLASLQSGLQGLGEGLAHQLVALQHKALSLRASTATAHTVEKLLRRILVGFSKEETIPCCACEEDLPELPRRLTLYSWQAGEVSSEEVAKGQRWLQTYLCPDGTVAIPVQNQPWLEAEFREDNANIKASKTDFLIAMDVPEVKKMANPPSPDQFKGILRYIIGAYEAKTTNYVRKSNIMCVWPQAVLQALALNSMTERNGKSYFIPVFGGDFNEHLVLHASTTQDPSMTQDASTTQDAFMLHAATQDRPEAAALAVRYMRYLLEQTKDAATASPQAGRDPSGVNPLIGRHLYDLSAGSNKRKHEEMRTAGGPSEGSQAEGAQAEGAQAMGAADADEDERWQAAENAYHRDLVDALRHPRMYRALGLSGPPHTIRHSSLEENLNNMRLIL